jgi:hypothetical protein
MGGSLPFTGDLLVSSKIPTLRRFRARQPLGHWFTKEIFSVGPQVRKNDLNVLRVTRHSFDTNDSTVQ